MKICTLNSLSKSILISGGRYRVYDGQTVRCPEGDMEARGSPVSVRTQYGKHSHFLLSCENENSLRIYVNIWFSQHILHVRSRCINQTEQNITGRTISKSFLGS